MTSDRNFSKEVPNAPKDTNSLPLEGTMPLRRMFDFERAIPDLTGGEGACVAEFDGYQKAQGATSIRERTDNNPFNKEEYLRRTLGRG